VAVRPRLAFRSVAVSAVPTAKPRYDFSAGVPDVRQFPFAEWRRSVSRALRGVVLDGGYPDPAGRADLRAAIARFVSVSRAVKAGPDDVVVTHGAQQALDLIARVLVEPGTCVAVEEPGYPRARQVFASYGARIALVPVDDEGLVVSRLPDAARLVYVTPSHQFPLGMPMSLERRLALLHWAARRGAVIVEDDYDTELRFSGRPLEPMQSVDRVGRVLYVATFSKVMLPSLRLGFVVAPASLRPALVAAKRLADGGCAEHDQAALARFLDDGHLARHIRRTTREYAARRDAITAILARDFAPWLRVVPGAAGLHISALAGPKVDVERAVEIAAAKGVAVETLAAYYAKAPAQPGFILGYGAIPTARIAAGMKALLAAVRAARR
jgi:GntR family transcriptional regulator/MocR family aminotransferase